LFTAFMERPLRTGEASAGKSARGAAFEVYPFDAQALVPTHILPDPRSWRDATNLSPRDVIV
jgi:hypothetical protein